MKAFYCLLLTILVHGPTANAQFSFNIGGGQITFNVGDNNQNQNRNRNTYQKGSAQNPYQEGEYYRDPETGFNIRVRGSDVVYSNGQDEYSVGSQGQYGRFVSGCNNYVCVRDEVIYAERRFSVAGISRSSDLILLRGLNRPVRTSDVAITHGRAGSYYVGDRVLTTNGNSAVVVGIYQNRDLAIQSEGAIYRRSQNRIAGIDQSDRYQVFQAPQPIYSNERVNKVHIEVRNIALTGECPGYEQCFRMFVYLNNRLHVTWKTSPGMPHNTERGVEGEYTPEWTNATPTHLGGGRYRLEGADYVSKSYPVYADGTKGGAPMPYAIFFNNTGIAIHGSNAEVNGEQASHGCMRLLPENARQLSAWVAEAGGENTTLTVRDTDRLYTGG